MSTRLATNAVYPKSDRTESASLGASSREAAEVPFAQAASAVLTGLQRALADLLAAAPVEIRKSTDVERVFGVHHLLGWQTYRITRAKNPLAVGMHVPAKISLSKLLAAAARLNISATLIDRVAEAFEAFDRLVESNARDRDELQAMLNAFIPDERSKQDLASKELIFKGMSQVKGVAFEADLCAAFYAPSAVPGNADVVSLLGDFGLRRMRSDGRIVLSAGDLNHPKPLMQTLEGRPFTNPVDALLPQFSTSPLPPFDTQELDGMVYHFVEGEDVGMRSAVDLVSAEIHPGIQVLKWTEGKPFVLGPTIAIDTPVRRLTFDAFLHRDVFPGVTPQLRAYDTAVRGWVRMFGDPRREHDRLSTEESIRELSPGLDGASLPHIPRYREMLEHVYATLGWDVSEFRGFRMDIQYPIYGAQYMMGFRLPGAPEGD